MRKLLLASIISLPLFSMAQTEGSKRFVQVSPEFNQAAVALPDALVDITPTMNPNNPMYYASKKGNSVGAQFIQVGRTLYDLQTNASMGRRIFLHSDGSVSLTWTTSPEGVAGFPLRGSGYNHGDGDDFVRSGDVNGNRIETTRTGWPSIGVLPGGIEYIIGHDATNGGFRMSKNTGIGSENWTTGPAILQYAGGQRPIWNRAANNGNSIHLIANFSDSSAPGDPRVISLNGVRGPMLYSRSLDAGATWDKTNTLLPGYDSTRIYSGGGDNYAIDVAGDMVAIVAGGLGDDIILWKSTDNGETFTRTIVDSFPYAPNNYKKLMIDTPMTNDGSMDVLIDNNGNCHVFWGVSRVLDTDTTDESISLFPATAMLVYWNEISGEQKVIGGIVDENSNDTLDIRSGTWANGVRTGNTSLVTMPTAGIDAQGRIFLTYSAPRENDLSIDNNNCRDIYLVYSTDDGETWSDPQNITQKQAMEDAFPAMARRVDNFVHVVWQQDENPGSTAQASATGGVFSENQILYAAIPVSRILANQIGQGPNVSIRDLNAINSEIFTVSQNYPNPFSNETNVLVYLTEQSDLTLTVMNLMGQVVVTKNLGTFAPGNSTISIDGSGLSSGIYTYSLSTGTNSVGNKMIVK